jgi:YD repeat-containing protein
MKNSTWGLLIFAVLGLASCADSRSASPDGGSESVEDAYTEVDADDADVADPVVPVAERPPEECVLIRSDGYHSHDGPVSNSSYYFYDAGSNKVRVDFDKSADGTVEAFDRWEYDDSGNMTLYERHYSGDDARLRSRMEYEYNELDQLVVERRDPNGDGEIDVERTQTWESSLLKSATEVVRAGDDRFYQYFYRGELLVKVTHKPEFSSLDQVLYEYDTEDRLVAETAPHAPDSEPYWTERFEYDAQGRLSREARIRMDGALMSELRLQYNDEGLLERTLFYVPSLATPKFEYRYQYDAGGKKIEEVFIQDGEENLRHTKKLFYECF